MEEESKIIFEGISNINQEIAHKKVIYNNLLGDNFIVIICLFNKLLLLFLIIYVIHSISYRIRINNNYNKSDIFYKIQNNCNISISLKNSSITYINNNNINKIIENKCYENIYNFFRINEEIDYNKSLEEINNYRNHSFNSFLEIKEIINKNKNPKISIVITIYNQQNFIEKIYSCIQNQSIKEIEIIFIDDASFDNSSEVIKTLMNKDKRIFYYKNTENKGQFYSRYKGIKQSTGEYTIVIDPDDLLLNDILILYILLFRNKFLCRI